MITWRTLAIGGSLLAVAALTTLLIQTATSDADALSSVALILAVLAFVIQIIVFIADFSFNSRRDKEASELNASTQALLAKIEEKANTTNQAVTVQMTKMLDRILRGENLASKEEFSDPAVAEARRDLLNEIRAQVASERPPLFVDPSPVPPPEAPSQSKVRQFRQWPRPLTVSRLTREGIEEFTSDEVDVLAELADDVRKSYEHDLQEGLGEGQFEKAAVDNLVKRGFIERTDMFEEGGVTLTAKGIAAARLYSAEGEIPDYVAVAFPSLAEERERVRARGIISQ